MDDKRDIDTTNDEEHSNSAAEQYESPSFTKHGGLVDMPEGQIPALSDRPKPATKDR